MPLEPAAASIAGCLPPGLSSPAHASLRTQTRTGVLKGAASHCRLIYELLSDAMREKEVFELPRETRWLWRNLSRSRLLVVSAPGYSQLGKLYFPQLNF